MKYDLIEMKSQYSYKGRKNKHINHADKEKNLQRVISALNWNTEMWEQTQHLSN